MRQKFALILSILFIPVLISAQEFKTLRDGIEYAEVTRGTEKEPVHINLLRLDLKKVRLDVVHALDAAIGLEKTSSIASRHGAFAAINAGFFKMDGLYKGDAAGVLMIDRVFFSESVSNRTTLFIQDGKNGTNVGIGRVQTAMSVKIGDQQSRPILGINRERKQDDLVVFTDLFHRSTLTDQNGVELICKNGVVLEVLEGRGSSLIPPGGVVLSASGLFKDEFKNVKKGERVVLDFRGFLIEGDSKFELAIVDDIVGGVPQLIKNGKIDITWEQEKINKDFVTTRHPRTAVAKLKDGKFLMVTVDGRQAGYSIGMNLEELAAFLLEQGAVDAMNLDGGGSTTMFLDGKVGNKPSDKDGERSVSDAILVFPRKR